VFGKTEFDYWAGVHAKTPVPVIEDSVMPIVEARRFEVVGNDHQIGDHVRILPTPGHTPGHSAFVLGRGKDDAVFSGDLMHSPVQTHYPELSIKFDVDPSAAAKTCMGDSFSFRSLRMDSTISSSASSVRPGS